MLLLRHIYSTGTCYKIPFFERDISSTGMNWIVNEKLYLTQEDI